MKPVLFIDFDGTLCHDKFWRSLPPETLSNLKLAYHVVLMTDNMDSFDRFTVPSLNLTSYFDLIVNSYNEKRGKDDENGRNFTEVIENYHSTFEGSVLIDNSQKSCELFERLGGKSYHVTVDQDLAYWLTTEFA